MLLFVLLALLACVVAVSPGEASSLLFHVGSCTVSLSFRNHVVLPLILADCVFVVRLLVVFPLGAVWELG